MLTTINTSTALRFFRLALPSAAAILGIFAGGPVPHARTIGVPDDWSHRHVVFSNPGTAAQAMRNGGYARWARTVSTPRYILQQLKRGAAARAEVFSSAAPGTEELTASEEAVQENSGEPLAEGAFKGLLRTSPMGPSGTSPENRRPLPPRRRLRQRLVQTDWSLDLGSGATLGMGIYPAKYSFSVSSANCGNAATPDFVVYNTSLAGSGALGSTQASLVAIDNLYSGCSGGLPAFYWAYDTNGGAILTSVTLSLDGSQMAFVQTNAGVASLVVLKWAAGAGTPSSPTVLGNTAAASYRSCPAPCMTALAFSGGANDSTSSVFYDYGSDTAFVGDDSGMLHKFTGLFQGTPVEATSPWPVTVSAGAGALASPVLDSDTGQVFVGDYVPLSAPSCAPGVGCGYLYSVNAGTGAIVTSARLDYNVGLVDAPLLDLTAGKLYVFAGSDDNFMFSGSPCGSRLPCSGVFQFPVGFSPGATGTEAILGLGNDFMYSGAFDNLYFSSGNHSSPTGNLYALGNTGGDITLYQVPIAAGIMGAPVAGPVVSVNSSMGGLFSPAMPVTEIYTGAHDYIFTSTLYYGEPMSVAFCGAGNISTGCVMGFDVTSGVISGATSPTGATPESGGVSGIIIDNIVSGAPSGASNIYYSPLANQLCPTSGGTGGCAIQISQAAP